MTNPPDRKRFDPVVLRIATEEASEILSKQPALAGYDSLEKAFAEVRKALAVVGQN